MFLRLFVLSVIGVQSFTLVGRWPTKNGVLKLGWFVSKQNIFREKELKNIINKAFEIWSKQWAITINFFEVEKENEANITISWHNGDHRDGYPFDDSGHENVNVLAHTFYPTKGNIHFDSNEQWVLKKNQNGVFFPYVLVHEIGHALGLGHSSRKSAIMYKDYKTISLSELALDIDDLCGIDWLYNHPSSRCLFVRLLIESRLYIKKEPI